MFGKLEAVVLNMPCQLDAESSRSLPDGTLRTSQAVARDGSFAREVVAPHASVMEKGEKTHGFKLGNPFP